MRAPPSSTFTQATTARLDPSLLRHRGTRRTRLQLRARRSRPIQERSGRPHAHACEGAGPRERRSRLGGPPGDAGGHATSGCPVAAPVLSADLHTALIEARGATAARLQSSRLQAAGEVRRGSYIIVDHAAAVGAGTSDAQSLHRIEELHPFARRWRRPASYWMRKAPCFREQGRCCVLDQGVRSLDQGRDRSLRLSIREALTGPGGQLTSSTDSCHLQRETLRPLLGFLSILRS